MHYTGSPRAGRSWTTGTATAEVRKVMPVEYRRALEEMERMRMNVAAE
jgi:glutamate synthase (NADPH/NADH) large chain